MESSVRRLERFYEKLPIPLQHAACSLERWRAERVRYGGEFPALLDRAERRTSWSEDETRAYRDEHLRAVVAHCVRTVPFYRRRFRELGIAPGDIHGVDDLGHLPVLTRRDVQDRSAEFRSDAAPMGALVTIRTGGTTGAGLRLTTTLRAVQEQWATWWRWWRWLGIERGTLCGYFAGRPAVPISQARPPFWRYNLPGRQIRFSTSHLSPSTAEAYVDELRRRRPPWLHGWPGVLASLATHIADGADLGYRVRWVTTGSATLLPQQAELLERAFGVTPRQHYGLTEGVANFSECERGSLHVDEDFAAVEFLPNPDGPGFRVVGTNLTNPATPLLRYDTGDLVTLGESRCACGRPGRVVAAVDGRADDYVILKSGARLSGGLSYIFKSARNIREAQIHQARPGEVTIRVVRGPGYTEVDEAALLREAGKRLGDTDIGIEYAGALARSPSGKVRLVVSSIPEGRLTRVGTLARPGH